MKNRIDLKKIKQVRKSKKISAQYMAKLLGYKTHFGYYHLENGDREIKAWQLPIIAEILDLNIQDLFLNNDLLK